MDTFCPDCWSSRKVVLFTITLCMFLGHVTITIWPLWALMNGATSSPVFGPIFLFKGIFAQVIMLNLTQLNANLISVCPIYARSISMRQLFAASFYFDLIWTGPANFCDSFMHTAWYCFDYDARWNGDFENISSRRECPYQNETHESQVFPNLAFSRYFRSWRSIWRTVRGNLIISEKS